MFWLSQNDHVLISYIWPDSVRNIWQGPGALGFPQFSDHLLKGPWWLIYKILPGDKRFASQRNSHNSSDRPCPHTWVFSRCQSRRLPRFLLNGTWGTDLLSQMRSRINCETECLVEPPMTSHGHWSRRARPLGSRPRAASKWHPDCKSGGDIDSWLQTLLLAWDMPRRLLSPLPKREKVSAISLVSYIWHLSHCVVSDHAPVPLQWNLGRGICDLGNHDIAWEF